MKIKIDGMSNQDKVQLNREEVLSLIKITGFRPFNESSFFTRLVIAIHEYVINKLKRVYQCFFITLISSIIINVTISLNIAAIVDYSSVISTISTCLMLVSSLCLSYMFASVVTVFFQNMEYLLSNKFIFWEAVYDVIITVITIITLSFAYLIIIEPVMHVCYGMVKYIVSSYNINPDDSFLIFLSTVSAVLVYIFLSILNSILTTNNIKITKIALLILYYINLEVVKSYISNVFLSYIDYINFTFVHKYFDVFCALLVLISINYFILSYYAKVNYSYNNIHLNNLCKRLLSPARSES